MKKIVYSLTILIFTCFTVTGILIKPVSADTFNQNDIIDDTVFDDSNSMSESQIQSFLNAFPKSCLSNYSAPYPTDYSTYGNNVLASTVIKRVADLWQISPKVILVTLEKEENLITGNSGCDEWRYNSAVGMGCPDDGACPDPKYAGFSQQVTKGMWQLKFNEERSYGNLAWGDNGDIHYYGYMTAGNRSRQNSQPITYYDGYATIDNTSVYMSNGPTAALYTYTPHFHGNQNFQTIFNQWFGSTYFPQPLGASLYYQQSNQTIYLVDDSTTVPTYYPIPNWQMMQNYGLDAYPVLTVPDSTIQNMTNGGLLTNLIWDSGGVYLVNNGIRHHVSGDMCVAWGFSCFDGTKIKQLNATFQTQYLNQGGDLTNLSNFNGTVYEMSGGLRLPLANPQTLSDLGLSTTPQLSTSPSNSNQALGQLLITTPGILHFSSNSPLYYFDGSTYFKIDDSDSYNDWSMEKVPWLSVPDSIYSQSTPPFTDLTPWAIVNGNKYIIDQGQRLLIPSELTSLWLNVQFVTPPLALFNSLPDSILTHIVWANPYIYLLESGEKHYISSYDDFLGITSSLNTSITSIRLNKLSTVVEGNNALSDGKLLSINDGSGKIYIVNNHKLTYVSDSNILFAYGYSWTIYSYPTSITTNYPIDGTVLSNGVDSNGTYFIISGSSEYELPSETATDFGIISSKFMSISNQINKNNHVQLLSRFLYNLDDGKIYYASGGAIHYVATYSAFVAYGGTRTQVIPVTTGTLSLFTEAQPVY
jgi:hypothetical protein